MCPHPPSLNFPRPHYYSCCSCYAFGCQVAAAREGMLQKFTKEREQTQILDWNVVGRPLSLTHSMRSNAGQGLELYFSGVICWLHNFHLQFISHIGACSLICGTSSSNFLSVCLGLSCLFY